ncbi:MULTISPECIES: hypothetical protein [unclassified Nodularia (in: cyanobacteria)]|uniref:hypothetical protein n=1 Tax=unclassified Nodularia (in: cyanobacteria) TaxID=2656917 RepID=UPI001882172B|nr:MULTISPECIES: hypothetical protein [unclassified Nodularia (in: cyanobacteria)]MBE9200735.1 hypothetical protein [Nodularia sp. LEGE 06071]MCC2692055.1 hypothetical protein [Nodularia sp. LEGE 04288]
MVQTLCQNQFFFKRTAKYAKYAKGEVRQVKKEKKEKEEMLCKLVKQFCSKISDEI